MRYESFVGLRYLMAKRRSSVLSIITLISITGVALGVTALIVVLSVMGGFKKDLMDKILGTKAHIVIRAADYEAMESPGEVAKKARENPQILGAAPYVESEVMVSSPTNLKGVILRGVDPDNIGDVSTLERDMQEGELQYLADASGLEEALDAERDVEMEQLLERLDREREDVEDLRGDNPDVDVKIPEHLEDAADPPSVGADEDEGAMPPLPHEADGDDDSGMPPLPGQEETDSDDDSDGGMPPLPHLTEGADDADDGEDTADDEGESGMPPLPGQGGDDAEPQIPGLIVGVELAKSLQVDMGDELNVVTPSAEMGPMGPMPRSRPFRVVGIFYSGMYEYDANYAYTHITDAQDFLAIAGATGIELKTTSVEGSKLVAEQLQRNLGPSVEVLDWQELNKSLFYALNLEKIAMFIVLTFIILVASFSIVAMLIMIVIEKGREIAVLKSMGATNAGIMRTFIFQGAVIGTFGAVIGLGLGLAICYFLATVGFPLNSEVYYINTLPVEVNPVEVGLVVTCAIVISLLATIYPSIQAARLNPVDGLRYD